MGTCLLTFCTNMYPCFCVFCMYPCFIFLHYIEGFLLGTCGKIAKKHWFYGIFRRFRRAFMCWSVCGCIADCKSWKEKVFVLSDYIYTYMFHLCSWMFRAAAIEKNSILFELYQNSRTKNRQQKRIKRKYVRFYYRKCVRFECEKIMYYHIQCIGGVYYI